MGRKIDSVLKGFIAQKCLTLLKLTTPRITVSRNRRNLAVRQMRGEIAQLLRSGHATRVYDTKIESLIKEENMVAVYDLLEHFCNSIISQFPVVEMQRFCPPDLKEPIATLIYAAPRCVELAELHQVKDLLVAKYGKEFAIAADEVRQDCGVNRQVIEMLSLRPVSEQTKVRKMREICLQHNIEWRSEWTPGHASDLSNQARVDNRRPMEDEESSRPRPAVVASSSIRPSNLVQDMKEHPHRQPRHGEGVRANMRISEGREESYKAEEVVSRANMRVSEGANEPSRPPPPGVGQKVSHALSREELAKPDKKVSESVNEPYKHSPDLGRKIPKEEIAKANTRVSEGMNKPYEPAYDSKHSSLRQANIKNSKDDSGSGPRKDVPRDKVPRADLKTSEGTYKSSKPNAASLGNYKAAEYKQDGAGYHAQHHDELSDSGSEVFVCVEDDEVAVSYKDKISSTATEDHSSNLSLGAGSLRAIRETSLSVERSSLKANQEKSLNTQGSPYDDSFRADQQTEEHYAHRNKWAEEQSFKTSKGNQRNEPRVVHNVPSVDSPISLSSDPSEVEDEFASTAKAIAAEAARLAILDYARRYSRSGSISMDIGDLTGNALESRKGTGAFTKTNMSSYDEDGGGHVGFKRDSNKETHNRLSDIAADYTNDIEYDWHKTDKEADVLSYKVASNADVIPFARTRGDKDAINQANKFPSLSAKKEKEELETPSQSRRGEKPQFNNERCYNQDVNTRFNDTSSSTYNYGKPTHNMQGKSAEDPTFDRAAFMQKRETPISDEESDFYFDSPQRNKHSQEMLDRRQQHQSSSKFKERKNTHNEHEPYYDAEGREGKPSYANQMNHDMGRQPTKETHSIHQHKSEREKIIAAKTAGHSQAMHKSSSNSPRQWPDEDEDVQDKAQLKKTNADPNASKDQLISKRTPKSPIQFAQQHQMTHEDSDEGEPYARDRNWNAASTHDRENSIRARPRKDNDKWEATSTEEHTMNQRKVSSPVKRNKEALVTEQDKVQIHIEKAQANNRYNINRQSISSPQQGKAKEDMEKEREAVDSMPSRSSNIIHPHSRKNRLDDVLNAKWHGDNVYSADATQHDKMENIRASRRTPSSYPSVRGSYNTQNNLHEPATNIEPLVQDNYKVKRNPNLQQEHQEADLISLYKPHGQVDDLVKRRPSNLISTQHKSHSENVQTTASDYKPYEQHDSMGRKTGKLQGEEERKSPSKNNVGDQKRQQGRNQSEQDPWPKREQPQNHNEHQKSSFNQGATSMTPSHQYEPPRRKPPPLPHKNTSISDRDNHAEASKGQLHSHSPSQKKQEEEKTSDHNYSTMLNRRSQQPTRPPPQIMANMPTGKDRKSPAKVDREDSRPVTRPPPATPTRRTSSDPVISLSSSVSASAKIASSISADPPSPATPQGPTKLPHVDEIAANLEALRQAKLARLRKPD